MTVTKWTPDEVKKMVVERIEPGMDMAGKFVEDQARRKLDGIKNPDTKRDKNYRAYLSGWVLTHTVEAINGGLLTRIGMQIGQQGQRFHGFYIETGSSKIAAQPYLRPALFNNISDVLGIIVG